MFMHTLLRSFFALMAQNASASLLQRLKRSICSGMKPALMLHPDLVTLFHGETARWRLWTPARRSDTGRSGGRTCGSARSQPSPSTRARSKAGRPRRGRDPLRGFAQGMEGCRGRSKKRRGQPIARGGAHCFLSAPGAREKKRRTRHAYQFLKRACA